MSTQERPTSLPLVQPGALGEWTTQVACLPWFTLLSIQAYRLGGIGSNARAR